MKKFFKRFYTPVAAFFGLTLLLIITFLSYQSGQDFLESDKWREHTDKVISSLYRVQTGLDDLNKIQRNFVIRDIAINQAEFQKISETLGQTHAELDGMVQDNPAQLASANRLENMINYKVDLITVDGKSKLNKVDLTEAVFDSTDKARAILNSMVNEEFALLKIRANKANASFRSGTNIVIGGLMTAFFLLFGVTFLLLFEIRQRSKIQKELVHAEMKAKEASELKSQFLANMSHEIRTPLNGIMGLSKLMLDTKLDAEQRDFIQTIRESSTVLLSLINDILDFSKIESGKLQVEELHFDLHSLMDSTHAIIKVAANAKDIKLKVNMDKSVPNFLLGDPLRLRQIILNLLSNAIKFSNNGEEVFINITSRGELNSKVDLYFEVEDKGVGMDQETLGKLFQSFSQGDQSTTRKYGGSGLGLAISKQLIEIMGGTIGVESTVGKGTKFFFDLSFKMSKHEMAIQVFENDQVKQQLQLSGNALVVEDNLTNQKVIVAMLKRLGVHTKIANNGVEALAILKNERFDVILMDGQMPEMDGYEATRQIRAGVAGPECQRTPIIATTANAIKGDLEKCLQAGMNDYISKPISFEDLSLKLSKTFKQGERSIDSDVILQLRKLESQPEDRLVEEIVAIFKVQAPKAIAKMRCALGRNDLLEVSKIAHNLKSSCANVGAVKMRTLAEKLEKQTSTDMESLNLLLDAMENEFNIAREELDKHAAA
ncbi:MAG: ATP-binding protein [Bdellovibrionota bacterium]